ncbi:MAG: 2-oxoacid:acceptor oxidoreductase family protein [Planctomycetes bacterium]|nr:2-oxoacid:acceptor oxidoreductase family protein [Planctomycetota bacterium]
MPIKSYEVRFHGRGGQGVVIVSKIIGYAAFLNKSYIQCFPEFGVERRGAPVKAFLRISNQQIFIRSSIEKPDCIVVLDPMLLSQHDTLAGASSDCLLIINSRTADLQIQKSFNNICVVNASDIAVQNGLGTATTPIVNTAIAGAFAQATEIIQMKHLEKAILKYSPAKIQENVKAAYQAYNTVSKPIPLK